jgi:hypothetical protein
VLILRQETIKQERKKKKKKKTKTQTKQQEKMRQKTTTKKKKEKIQKNTHFHFSYLTGFSRLCDLSANRSNVRQKKKARRIWFGLRLFVCCFDCKTQHI